jgi:F-type H+-transporting ATPase subunit c
MGYLSNEAALAIASVFAAALAMFPAAMCGLSQGKATAAAVEAIGKQPEAAKEVRSTLIMGLALTESSGIYGFVIAILLVMMNPLMSFLG